MANLDRIVNITVRLLTTSIRVPNFKSMLIAAPHALSSARVMGVTSMKELSEMGLSSDTKLYKAVAAVFKQSDGIKTVYIGKQAPTSTKIKVKRLVVGDYTVKVGGDTVTQVAVSNSTANSVASGLATKLAALSSVTSATASGDIITIECGDFALKTIGELSIGESSSAEDINDTLSACNNSPIGWYGLAISSRDEVAVKKAADWTEANKKLFITASSDQKIGDGSKTNDIASELKLKQMFRTAVFYDKNANSEYLDCAVMSKCFSYYPGQETWSLKKIAGITADIIPEGEAQVAFSKNANTFEMINDDFAVTQNGKVAGGEWIDVIRFRDWLEATMQADVASAMINADGKVPYNDEGIAVLANAMLPSLELGVRRKGIDNEALDNDGNVIPSFKINKPLASNISQNAKASRKLEDLNATARLAGAIHVTDITVNLKY